MKFSDYIIKMPNLEYTESIPKCGYRKIHSCNRCPYVTKSLFYMVNHAASHRLPLESFSCESNNLENYYCKDCNFEADLVVIFKQHLKQYHRNGTDCVQDQPKNDTVVKSYICQRCSFETHSVLLWIKHLESACFDTEEECETVHTVSCSDEKSYQCDYCYFKTKEATVLKRHQTANHSLHQKERFPCFRCKYKGTTQNHLREHVNRKHATSEAVHWFHCNECQFISPRYKTLQFHEKSHHQVGAIQWYSCDKCEYKTKYKHHLNRHKINHLPADAIQWYNCDKCEFKTKRNDNLKQHEKHHLSPYFVQWYRCDKCRFKAKRKHGLKIHKITKHSTLNTQSEKTQDNTTWSHVQGKSDEKIE
jgi:hypothetical protein